MCVPWHPQRPMCQAIPSVDPILAPFHRFYLRQVLARHWFPPYSSVRWHLLTRLHNLIALFHHLKIVRSFRQARSLLLLTVFAALATYHCLNSAILLSLLSDLFVVWALTADRHSRLLTQTSWPVSAVISRFAGIRHPRAPSGFAFEYFVPWQTHQ